ncbi:MAG TPA: 16S rRNA (guanine(527)-N(7))-methyltransferase RsmG [Candidatus Binatia bacterium]|nr:16S rRNA (guanine(527)-N(7))-methyltransferase RsmG [Candidatus Binatia bacterium]
MTPAEARALRRGAERFGVEPDVAALDRLERYLATFEVWRRRIGLTSERDVRLLIERHVVDSFAAAPDLPARGRILDIGSGAGFPGLILGCLRPDLELVLIDSRRKRASFLLAAIRATGLPNARALELRAEDAATDAELAGSATVVIARALRLDAFVALGAPLLAVDGRLVAMQTPGAARAAGTIAETHGVEVVAKRDYALADGARRTIFVFAREKSPPTVS